MSRSKVVIRRPNDAEDVLLADSVEISKNGSLSVFNTEISSKTTTEVSKFLFWKSETTQTSIEKHRYTSAIYPAGKWIAAYSKYTLCTPPKLEVPSE